MTGVPAPMADRDSAQWWAAVADHRLLLQRCAACSHLRLLPRAICARCGSFEWSHQDAQGAGSVASWTVVHRAVDGRSTPYTVVLVRLVEADHLIMPGAWTGAADGSDLTGGLVVHVAFIDSTSSDAERTTTVGWTASRASA